MYIHAYIYMCECACVCVCVCVCVFELAIRNITGHSAAAQRCRVP